MRSYFAKSAQLEAAPCADVEAVTRNPHCWLQAERARYFSLARHAMVEALRIAGAGRGDRILLPEFVCRDLLASITAIGATPCWYAVTPALTPAADAASWPDAAAVVAVNYFGFAQDLAPFRRYAARTGAALIEDNAHGFLSSDDSGQWLGCRADIGVFSFRKTASRLNGASLVVTNEKFRVRLCPQLSGRTAPRLSGSRIKHLLRRLPVVGPQIAGTATGLAQRLRAWRTGHALPPSAADAELVIPGDAAPGSGLIGELNQYVGAMEVARRRKLYEYFLTLAANLGVTPVYPQLPDGTSPYGFAFRAKPDAIQILLQEAARRGLDVLPWPDLPAAIQPAAPAHYRDLWLVNFLW